MGKYFSSSDLKKIQHNTNINNHTENYVFIASKIKSKKLKKIKEIKKRQDLRGYLSMEDSELLYKYYRELLYELKLKSPLEYPEVYSRT